MAKAPKKTTRQKSPKPPKRPKRPSNGLKWNAFLTANPACHTAIFAKATPSPKGLTLTKAVRTSLKILATGKWETMTIKQAGKTAVFVAFANLADFNTVKAHHKGSPWQSTLAGASSNGFSVLIP